ncbi:MAG: aminoglycoside phosphotransferase family protein [Oscillochloris sp.]|nr:aminoglycoside phosphotransferase family protein [Oscillochloris sp.]
MISETQVARILAVAQPGARLLAVQPLGERTLMLELQPGKPLVLRLGDTADRWAGDPLRSEVIALEALRAEIDLPLPQVIAADDGSLAEVPFLLLSYLEGTTLLELHSALDEDSLYAVGGALAELIVRVHGYSVPNYGRLDAVAAPQLNADLPFAGDADVQYLARRIDVALVDALAAGEIDQVGVERIRSWVGGNLAGSGRPACLVHGDLRPERVLLRRRERGWAIAGLTGWGYAQAWRPAWDHAALFEQFAGREYFSLRVGYGNAYDGATERHYDQLREFALQPYRLVLYLEAGRADLALALCGDGGTP